ncbi:MAG: NEW3 domain-containing protein [Candidatus Micrarchaeota archaeon]
MRWRAQCLFVMLLLAGLCAGQTSETVVSFIVQGINVRMTDVSVSPASINQGATADVSVTMQNIGTAATNVTAYAGIYDVTDTLVSMITYDQVTIAPGQTVTLEKVWDSDSFAAGVYTARANASYDGNRTNTVNASFTITIPSPPGPGGGVSGGLPTPEVVPPSIIPVVPLLGKIKFLKSTVLREVLAGEGGIESVYLKNTGSGNLTVDLSLGGVPLQWVSPEPNHTVILPEETRVVNLLVSPPKEALAGNYIVRVGTSCSECYEASDYMVLRVKSYEEGYAKPVVLKSVRVDDAAEETLISLDIKNPSQNRIKVLTVKETIPPDFGGDAEVSFKDKRGMITEVDGARVVSWEFSDVAPGEEVHVSYSVSGVLNDYATYAGWHVRQVSVSERINIADLVRISDLTAQRITAGKEGEVKASIIYTGTDSLSANVMLEVPGGFEVDPGTISTALIPRGQVNMKFRVKVPETESAGTHLIRLVVFGDKFQVSETSTLIIEKVRAEPPQPFLTLPALRMEHALVFVVVFVVVLGVLAAIRRRGRGPRFEIERLKYLRNIKRTITGE